MNRREFMAGVAAVAVVPAAPAVAKIAGVNDRPQWLGPQRYSGPGWYAFETEREGFRYGFAKWCELDDHAAFRFIAMKAGPDLPVEQWMSSKFFDQIVTGRLYTVDEIDRRNGRGKYAGRV